jgi:hypothetical protein
MSAEEITKSVYSTIKDRLVSPFYGTFIIAWLLWNWRIPYLTFFVDSSKLGIDKLTIIEQNLIDNNWRLYVLPVISTFVLLFVFPFVTNWVLSISLWFDRKRDEIKQKHNSKITYTFDEFNKYFIKANEYETKYNELNVITQKKIKDFELEQEQFNSTIQDLHQDIVNIPIKALEFYKKNKKLVNFISSNLDENQELIMTEAARSRLSTIELAYFQTALNSSLLYNPSEDILNSRFKLSGLGAIIRELWSMDLPNTQLS